MRRLHFAILTERNRQDELLKSEYAKYPGFVSINLGERELYAGLSLNQHHWKTAFVWNNFIPLLMNKLEIDFNPDDFVKKQFYTDDDLFDLSYHDLKEPDQVSLTFLLTKLKLNMKSTELRLSKNDQGFGSTFTGEYLTDYHRLFRGAHESTILENDSAVYDRYIILNSDSFMIPVIPILSHYYKKMLILDNRYNDVHNNNVISAFLQSDPDYVGCLWHKNILDNTFKYTLNLQ